MSVMVKCMRMPTECGLCEFCNYYYCTVAKQYCGRSAVHGRALFCPLIELPKEHGRLIDADALIAKYGDWYTEEGAEEGFIGTLEMLLKDAPTVVEAEGDNADNN